MSQRRTIIEVGRRGRDGDYTGATEVAALKVSRDVMAALRFDPAHPNYGAVRGAASTAQRTANTAAINLAASDAATAGGTLVIKGEYEVSGTINVRCHLDAHSGSLVTHNTAIAPLLRIGDPAEGAWIAGLNVVVPQLKQGNKPTPVIEWNANDIGLELVNLNSCHIVTQRITDFQKGILIGASGTGFVYNDITLGWLEHNKINLHMHIDRPGPGYSGPYGGWVQENVFINGRFHHNGSTTYPNTPGTRHILIDDLVGNNVFLKPSIEGNVPEWHIECGGMNNMFINGRYEASPPRVRFHPGASNLGHSNVIQYGWGSQNIQLTDTGQYNHIYTRNSLTISGSGDGVITARSGSGNSAAAFTVMPPTGGDPATAYTAALSAQYSRFKGTADAHPRVQINNFTGAMAFSNGTVAPTAYFGPYGATGITMSGAFLNLGATNIGFFGKAPVTQRAARANTSGAALAALETELNAIKQYLRDLGLMAT